MLRTRPSEGRFRLTSEEGDWNRTSYFQCWRLTLYRVSYACGNLGEDGRWLLGWESNPRSVPARINSPLPGL